MAQPTMKMMIIMMKLLGKAAAPVLLLLLSTSTTTATTAYGSQPQQPQPQQSSSSSSSSLYYLRQLWGGSSSSSPNSNHLPTTVSAADRLFLDGSETYYAEQAQAWRLLGFYEDCNSNSNDNNNNANNDRSSSSCQRYVLWAAYIDVGYTSDTHYQYYDQNDCTTTASSTSSSSGGGRRRRCVKMDCHSSTTSNTPWKLLGVFKQANIGDFVQSLTQYQGDCVWTDDEYQFMTSTMMMNGHENDGGGTTGMVVEGCTLLDETNGLYYDTPPSTGGTLTMQVYMDDQCTQSYNNNNSENNIAVNLQSWNSAMQAFSYCQPCPTVNVINNKNKNANGDRYSAFTAANNNNGDGDDNDDGGNDDDDNNDNNENAQGDNYFVCPDAASAAAAASANNGNGGGGDDNNNEVVVVNQCSLFAQDGLQVASYRDIQLAESQGTVHGIHIGTKQLGEPYRSKHVGWSVVWFVLSVLLLAYAFYRLYREDRINSDLKEPLVGQKQQNKNSSSNKTSSQQNHDDENEDNNNKTSSSNATSNKTSSKSGNNNNKRSFWGRKTFTTTSTTTTAILAMTTVALLCSSPAVVSAASDNKEVVGRLGTTLAKGSDTECRMLQNKATYTFTLDPVNLETNCVLVPGNAADMYQLVLTGGGAAAAAADYRFDLLEIDGQGYRTTPGSWSASSQGMEYCAPGGSMLYFSATAGAAGDGENKEITVSTTWLPDNSDGSYCCISQPIPWNWGIPRCSSIEEKYDEGVCWSSPNYFLKASSMEYRVARPHPLPDTVVTWGSRSMADNCASVQLSDGALTFETKDGPMTQTIATSFTSSSTGEERCLFVEVSKHLDRPNYWHISGAGVCNGRGGYEFFTPEQVNIQDVFIESCFEVPKLRMVNTKGSSLTFLDLQMEVFLPWADAEIGCDKTRYPSFAPSQEPSSEPSVEPSNIPSVEPSAMPSDVPSFVPSTTPSVTPSAAPTKEPTNAPSAFPTMAPTIAPSTFPTMAAIITVVDGSNVKEPGTPDIVYETADGTKGDKDDITVVYETADGTQTTEAEEEEDDETTGKKSKQGKKDPDDPDEGDESDGELVKESREQQSSSSGLTVEQLTGTVCGILLVLLLIVNCCFFRFYYNGSFGRCGRGSPRNASKGPGSNVPKEDPPGTAVTVEDLTGGKVMVKKVFPGNVVQKTIYPSQAEAAKNLDGYDYL